METKTGKETETEMGRRTEIYADGMNSAINDCPRLRSELRIINSFAPGGERALEPIQVVTLLYDAVFTHADLVRRTDGRQAVDSHARCRVDVEDVCLTRVGGEAGLIVVL